MDDFDALFSSSTNDAADVCDPAGPEVADDFDGLKIMPTDAVSVEERKIIIRGVYRTYVNSGSQASEWMCFPANLIINIKDLLDGEKYEKPFGNMNISAGPEFFESYSKMPYNQFDRAYFETNLYEEIGNLTTDHTVLEVTAEYNGAKSNTIVIHT